MDKAEEMRALAIEAVGSGCIREAYESALERIEVAARRGDTKLNLGQSCGVPYDGPKYAEVVAMLKEDGFETAYRDTYDPVARACGMLYVMW